MVPSRPDLPALLGRSAIFALLSAEARGRLAAAATPLALEPGQRLFCRGDEGDAAFLLLAGELEVSVQAADGREVVLARLGPGAVTGELALLDGAPRSAEVGAARRSQLLRIPRGALLDALRAEPDAMLGLVALLAARLRQADVLVEERALASLGARLARLLLAAGANRITDTQTQLARTVGASREKVNRKLGEWRRRGWVEMSPAGLRVADRAALLALAEPDAAHG